MLQSGDVGHKLGGGSDEGKECRTDLDRLLGAGLYECSRSAREVADNSDDMKNDAGSGSGIGDKLSQEAVQVVGQLSHLRTGYRGFGKDLFNGGDLLDGGAGVDDVDAGERKKLGVGVDGNRVSYGKPGVCADCSE